MALAIEGMKGAYRRLSADRADLPQRSSVPLDDLDSLAFFMPAAIRDDHQMAVKVVTVVPGNAGRGLPTIHALVLAFDPETGSPLALLEGGSLTAIRTGAGSGAATDVLARRDAHTAAIIGSGAQAETQLQAVCTVRQIRKVLVYSPNPEHRQSFANRWAGQAPVPNDVQAIASADEAVAVADIVCTATTSSAPVFSGSKLQPGTHINAVGSFQPHMEELDLETLKKGLVVVDSMEAAMQEAGELLGPIERGEYGQGSIHAELGQILNGQASGRSSRDQITVFKSVGVAVQDAAAAALAIERAQDLGLGTTVEL